MFCTLLHFSPFDVMSRCTNFCLCSLQTFLQLYTTWLHFPTFSCFILLQIHLFYSHRTFSWACLNITRAYRNFLVRSQIFIRNCVKNGPFDTFVKDNITRVTAISITRDHRHYFFSYHVESIMHNFKVDTVIIPETVRKRSKVDQKLPLLEGNSEGFLNSLLYIWVILWLKLSEVFWNVWKLVKLTIKRSTAACSSRKRWAARRCVTIFTCSEWEEKAPALYVSNDGNLTCSKHTEIVV